MSYFYNPLLKDNLQKDTSNGGTHQAAFVIASANFITNNLSDILTQYSEIKTNSVFVLTDIDENKTYYYTFNNISKSFKGNSDFDLLFKYVGNNEFKPISFSPIY